jgi:tetratricopeptide (TPR) repeat protein
MYPKRHGRVPFLLADFAFVLICHHHFSAALLLLDEMSAVIDLPRDQVLMFGSLARAAGGTGNRARFEAAREAVERLTATYEEFAAAALVNLAEGARSLGEWDQAEKYATAAREVAHRRRDRLLVQDAAELLDRIVARQPGPTETAPANPERLKALLLRFATKLRNWKAPHQKRSGASQDPPTGAQPQ